MAYFKSVKAALVFYLILFIVQLSLYFAAPSFYISAPEHQNIPLFIKVGFLESFGSILLLYLIWAFLLGSWNALILNLGRKTSLDFNRRETVALLTMQFLLTFLWFTQQFPMALHSYPLFRNIPLAASYLLLTAGTVLAAYYFAKHFSSSWKIAMIRLGVAVALPLILLFLISRPTELKFPSARNLETGALPDVLLLGFDALDGDSGNGVLKKFLEKDGGVLFTNAFTPLPLTHPAWHSILSGLYPKNHGVRYFFDSPLQGRHPELFLTKRLKEEANFRTIFTGDQPVTSYFGDEHHFDESMVSFIGWKAHKMGMMLNHFAFVALWLNNPWVEALSGRSYNYSNLYNFDVNRFFNRSLEKLSQQEEGPTFLALHSCYLHTPVHLQKEEIQRIYNYLLKSPEQFTFRKWPKPGDPQSDTPPDWINPYFVRRRSALNFLARLVEELGEKGYLAENLVMVLSDHGERFIQDREIYGGVHGVDLQTREQNNVMWGIFGPGLDKFQILESPVSLIDVTPTMLSMLGLDLWGRPYDGIPLLDADGRLLPIPERPIWIESMGYIDDSQEKVKFPQIAVKTLEESLIYEADGGVTIGQDYYQRVISKKHHADFSKVPGMLKAAKKESSTSSGSPSM